MEDQLLTRPMAFGRDRREVCQTAGTGGRQLGVVAAGRCGYAPAGTVGLDRVCGLEHHRLKSDHEPIHLHHFLACEADPGFERGAIEGVVPNREHLAGSAEKNFLVSE